jgi:hypothetical protein
MKKIVSIFLVLFIAILSSCTPVQIYEINASIELSDGSTESLYLEKNNERFIWTRTAEESRWGHFYFSFGNNDTYYNNSTEFVYMDSSNETIKFTNYDGNEYYEFEGSMIIYIYYNDSSDELKNIINSDIFNIEIGGTNWFSNPEIYK